MRLKRRRLSSTGLLLLSTISAIPVDAGIRPSFSVDECSWNATHIVLVQTTAKDGVFSVVESWKGDLKPGDSVEVPELRPGKDALPISKYRKTIESVFQDKSGISEEIPRQPIGSRMILFLNKQEGSGAGMPAKWGPASMWGGMRVSALWIDDGKAFCFQQWMNPGPSALSPCVRVPVTVLSSDVAVFTARLQEVLTAQQDLARALAVKDMNWRAERLGFIALGDVYPAQKEAVDALGKAGTVALPEILQVMDTPPLNPMIEPS